jgi:hypothetical protein
VARETLHHSVPEPLPKDALLAHELNAIGAYLGALASKGEEPDTLALELGALRAQLRLLADENREIGERLRASFDLEAPRPSDAG